MKKGDFNVEVSQTNMMVFCDSYEFIIWLKRQQIRETQKIHHELILF